MFRITGAVFAALAAIAIGAAGTPAANAAPALTGTGTAIIEGSPTLTEDVRWRGRRVVVVHRYRPARFHRPARFYRPYRPGYARSFIARPAFYGARCFWRPARSVWTPYGWRWRPAARVCRW
jgi:hypothetical protein